MTDNLQHGIQFRAYIGPRLVAEDDPQEYGKWDFATALGDDYNTPPHIGARTLNSTLLAAATSGLSVSGAALPAAAGVWVGPNGSGQGWEYIAYHSSGGALLRDYQMGNLQSGHNGIHTAGAPVYFWYPLDMNLGNVQLNLESSDNMAVQQWTAQLNGARAPFAVLKPEHLIIVTYKLDDMTVAESALDLLFVGFVDRVTVNQDTQRRGLWDIEIVCSARTIQDSLIPGVRFGPLNLALEADIDASSSLGAAWKLSLPQKLEAEAGTIPEIDLVELQQDLGPEHMTDDSDSTLWVSDGWLGNPASFANTHDHNAWASVFAYPPPSQVMGSRYIEIINHLGLDFTWYWTYQKYTYPSGSRGRWFQSSEEDMFQGEGIDDPDALSGQEDRLVIAEHAETFRRQFPAANPKFLIDAAQLGGVTNSEAVRRLWWEGGALFMVWSNPPDSRGYLIYWGNVTETELEDSWEIWGSKDVEGELEFPLPLSTAVDIDSGTIKPGMVIRRNFADVEGDAYIVDYVHHPGYQITNTGNNSPNPEWIKLILPKMTHVLRDTIDTATTTIFVVDGQGAPNVEGLSKNGVAGTIMVDDEVISFTGKDYYAGSLTGCTVTGKHMAGSKVYARWRTKWHAPLSAQPDPFDELFQDKVFDIATDAYPIERIEWGRGYYANGDDRFPYLGKYTVNFSLYEEARPPGEESYRQDYLAQLLVDSATFVPSVAVPNAAIDTTTSHFDPDSIGDGFRPKVVMFDLFEMWGESGTPVTARPRLNYIRVHADRRFFNPDTWIDIPSDGYANELIVRTLLDLSGQYSSLFMTFDDGVTETTRRRRGITERNTAWRVAVDMAEYGSSIIQCRRNGRIRIRANPYLLSTTHTPTLTLTDADIVSLQVANIRAAEVGQVRLVWTNGVTGASGSAVWPETARRGTSIIDLGDILANDQAQADAIAFNNYVTRRYPYNVFIELSESTLSIEIGQVHQVTYDFHRTGEMLVKILLVESVSIDIKEGKMRTVVGYREIDREVV
jgi:hypothetical protein